VLEEFVAGPNFRTQPGVFKRQTMFDIARGSSLYFKKRKPIAQAPIAEEPATPRAAKREQVKSMAETKKEPFHSP
jgi:hypothetical protein